MTTIITRVGKGTTLSFHEVDQNFTNLNDDKLENDGGAFLNGTIDNTTIGATTASSGKFTSLSDSGNLAFTGTGNRITGDFSNSTDSNRVLFQNSISNSSTNVRAIPNGTGTVTRIGGYNSSDPNNSAFTSIGIDTTSAFIECSTKGTGTVLPITFKSSNVEQMHLDTSGNLGIGVTPSGTYKLEVNGALNAGNTVLGTGNTDSDSRLVVNGPMTIANSGTQSYKWQTEIDSSTSYFSFNRYYSSGVWNLYDSGLASSYFISSNTNGNSYFAWATANSNTANPTESMKLDSTGKLTLTGGSGGTQLEMRNGGDLVIYNSNNTVSSSLYCDASKILYNDQRLVQSSKYYKLNGNGPTLVSASATTPIAIFGVGVTLDSNTQYEFEIWFIAAKTAGAVSHAVRTTFAGTLTYNSISYVSITGIAALNSIDASAVIGSTTTAATTTISDATAVASISHNVLLKGTFSVSSGGTWIPQFSMSAAPGGDYIIQPGAYVKVTPIGASGANINVGSWA